MNKNLVLTYGCTASETKSRAHVRKPLCIHLFGFTSSSPNLLAASLLPPCSFLKSLTSLSEFASNPYYCEKIIGSVSSPGYIHKVKTEKVAFIMSHQTICSFTDWTTSFGKHKAA